MVCYHALVMAKVCAITGKHSQVGGGYSNRTRATQFNPTGMVRKYPNLQKKKIYGGFYENFGLT